ncbi:SIR2 family NAD-dependent protein deacylase [Paraliomyxa miuraensis]|uniref:SIR2 family NAD-dependent protein deacylase n=1 Tax=Paraliomyxa miuraensis TaxID=376150 RepID=UPI00225664DE|nr:NAD-dependent protein deacylase [Paraliomyxa miuraensis]MCX4242382.1 NAD-dependent protein deacylase [Paraliomyxa miuraensis]
MTDDLSLPPMERFARWVDQAERILFITGAGISADSGLPTYRGVGGLYDGAGTEDGMPIEVALSGPMMHKRPEVCWKYIHQVERACRDAAPNRAHEVIAALQRRREGVVVLTQNVDGFHRAAGSEDVIEIHGNVHELHCTRCAWEQVVPDYAGLTIPPRCPSCDALVRPRVVLFGEMLPDRALGRLQAELARGFSLVVMVGTTAVFPYIAAPVHYAPRWGAHTVEINPGDSEVSRFCELRLPARAAPTFEALAAALGM